jgi:hypothetical protein
LESADGDDLALDVFAVDQDALVVDDIDDGGQLALQRTVVDAGDASDLDELVISLRQTFLTIPKVW